MAPKGSLNAFVAGSYMSASCAKAIFSARLSWARRVANSFAERFSMTLALPGEAMESVLPLAKKFLKGAPRIAFASFTKSFTSTSRCRPRPAARAEPAQDRNTGHAHGRAIARRKIEQAHFRRVE